MKSGKVLLGLLAGVAAGALVGILLAPDKGSKTRRKILSKGEDYANGLKGKFQDFLESLNEKYDGMREVSEDIISKGSTKYEEVKEEVAADALKFKNNNGI